MTMSALYSKQQNICQKVQMKVITIGKISANLAQGFNKFLINNIKTIRHNITSNMNIMLGTDPATTSQIKKVIESSPTKSCQLDPISTWLLRSSLHELLPILTKIVNTSLKAHVPAAFKSADVRPQLRKPDLDQNALQNY